MHAEASLSAAQPLLQLRELQSSHAGPVSLDLAAGECVAIRGASGSGKSVLLRMVADLDPHRGEALLGGRAAAACRRRTGARG